MKSNNYPILHNKLRGISQHLNGQGKIINFPYNVVGSPFTRNFANELAVITNKKCIKDVHRFNGSRDLYICSAEKLNGPLLMCDVQHSRML